MRSADVVVVNIARCFRGMAPRKKQPALMVSAPTCPRGTPPKYHTYTHTHTQVRDLSVSALWFAHCAAPAHYY